MVKTGLFRASLVVQWVTILLAVQGTWVPSLTREDPTCRRATEPLRHHYGACCSYSSPCNKGKPPKWEAHRHNEEEPALRTYRKPEHSNEDPTQPKIIFFFKDRGVRFPCLSFACHTYPIRQLRNKGRYADRQKGRDKAPEAGDWHAKSWGHREWNVMEQSAGARPDWGPPWELGCFLLRTVEDHGKNLSM